MGILLIDKNADFSAAPVGHAGLYTTVVDGLQSLFETRRSAGKAIHNSAPGGAPGSLIGTPVFSAGSANVALAKAIQFPSKPAAGHTIAVVVKLKNGGAAGDHVVSSWDASAATKGAVWTYLYNWQFSIAATSFAAGAVPPLSGNLNKIASKMMAAVATYEMFFGLLENNVSLRLYIPKTQELITTAAVGRDFVFDNAVAYKTVATGTAAQDLALFGNWSTVLTPTEMDTCYAEIKPQLLRSGIAI